MSNPKIAKVMGGLCGTRGGVGFDAAPAPNGPSAGL